MCRLKPADPLCRIVPKRNHGVMADDVLDELYWVKPDGFTALRNRLAAAAKQRGDNGAAKRISAARKPTTAAWVVNRLALAHKQTMQRLADLGERLRAAHAAMDGYRIRELSLEQRGLIDELARTAFKAAELKNPSAAVRDDVVGTLQAAIADPEVMAGLGRLAKAERWSGFGAFGETAPVFTDRNGKHKAQPEHADEAQLDELRAALAAAEHARAKADDTMSDRQTELAAARLRHEQALEKFRQAGHDLKIAEDTYDKAKRASRAAAELVREAKARIKRADNSPG
jgi:hypothetical protein